MAVVGRLEQGLHLGEHPVETVCANELVDHALVDARQVAHVIFGIRELLGVERAARPVREALGLGEVNARVALHKRAVAQLHAVAQEGGSELRVEHRLGNAAKRAVNDLEILGARVDHLDDRGVAEELGHGRQILKYEGVHGRDVIGRGGELDEAETRVIGALAQELSVDGEHL